MKILSAGVLALALAAVPAAAQKYQAGFGFGGSLPLDGESPRNFADFTDEFNPGFAVDGWVCGSISGVFGWRGELGYDRMKTDADVIGFDASYNVTRFMGGIELAPFETEGRGMPYFFFVVGGAHEAAESDGVELLEGQTRFGLSFGGGYNWNIGETWGIGADLHVNGGFFEDDNRWWITPSGQVFFRF